MHVTRTRGSWVPAVGEILVCHREGYNFYDPFAFAVHKGTMVVGHVPRCISAMCYTFLGKDGCHNYYLYSYRP